MSARLGWPGALLWLLLAGVARAEPIEVAGQSGASGHASEDSARGLRISVPTAARARVVIDGTFRPGEWDGAFRQPIGDNFEFYLLADSSNLYVGFKYSKTSSLHH